ncbi:serine/threonine-protein kinase Nek2-like [Ambystoma mexicanum]|uniref:serine/threonine-protein kinase Nek2-like n=1 Tax=Ambystoma mexicanum TaxID=8296 RepID=UPI0037E98CBF
MTSRLEDYQELRIVGRGTFGTCAKVKRKADGKILLWKEMNFCNVSDKEKQKLKSEVAVLREMRHPNIVRYYDKIYDRVKGMLYIVMEYCEGGDLAGLIDKHSKQWRFFTEDFILRIFAQLSSALKDCHRRSTGGILVLHRDLKPANIFLDANYNVKLGDFGLARILNQNSFAQTFAGTPCYMSPELVSGNYYNEKSDIWSLGCVVHEMCSLSRPFDGTNFNELTQKIKEGRFSSIPSRYSAELHLVIGRMLQVQYPLRPSVDDILQNPLLSRWSGERAKSTERPRCKVHSPGPCPNSDPVRRTRPFKAEEPLRKKMFVNGELVRKKLLEEMARVEADAKYKVQTGKVEHCQRCHRCHTPLRKPCGVEYRKY